MVSACPYIFIVFAFDLIISCNGFVIFSRSDPTENDSVEGLRPNARGPGLVTFGVCILFHFLSCFTVFDISSILLAFIVLTFFLYE